MAQAPIQQYYRKSYQDFSGGLNNLNSQLLISQNEFATLQNAIVNKSKLIEKSLGYYTDASPFPNSTDSFVRMMINYRKGTTVDTLLVAAQDNGNSNANYKVDIKTTSGDGNYSYITLNTGTNASFTNANTAVTGSGTSWSSQLKAGDKIKAHSHADSAYTEIATVNSDTSLTLVGGGYLGATASNVAYDARIILHKDHLPAATIFNGKAIITNGNEKPMSWDTSTIAIITSANAPKGNFICTHKNRVFMANTSGNPSNVYWSYANDETTWDATSFEPVYPNDGGDICAIRSYADSLIVFKNNGFIYQITGEFDQNAAGAVNYIRRIDITDNIGKIVGNAVVVHDDGRLYFLTETGVYAMDRGLGVEKMSWNIENTIQSILFRSTPSVSKTYPFVAASDWNTGTHNGTRALTGDNLLTPINDLIVISGAVKGSNLISATIDSSNTIHAVYVSNVNNKTITYFRQDSSNVTRTENITTPANFPSYVSIDVAPNGVVGVVYQTIAGPTSTYYVERSVDAAGPPIVYGTWITPELITNSSLQNIYGVRVRYNSSSNAGIVYTGETGGVAQMFYTLRTGVNTYSASSLIVNSATGLGTWDFIFKDDTHLAAAFTQMNANYYVYSSSNSGSTWASLDSFAITNGMFQAQLYVNSSGQYTVAINDGDGTIKLRNASTASSSTVKTATKYLLGYNQVADVSASPQTYTNTYFYTDSTGLMSLDFQGSNTITESSATVDTAYTPSGMRSNSNVLCQGYYGKNANEFRIRRIAAQSWWKSPQKSDSTLTAWGNYSVSQNPNNATITHTLSLYNSSQGSDPLVDSKYTQAQTINTVISSNATLIYISSKVAFVLGAFDNPTITSIVMNYTGSGVDSRTASAFAYKNELYFPYSETNQTANNKTLFFDLEGKWAIFDWPFSTLCKYKGDVYAGLSTKGDVVHIGNYNYAGSAYTTTAISKEDLLGSLELKKEIYKVYVIYQIKNNGSFVFSYRLNNYLTPGGSTWYDTTVDQSILNTSSPGMQEIPIPNGLLSSIQFKVTNANKDENIGIIGWVVVYGFVGLR